MIRKNRSAWLILMVSVSTAIFFSPVAQANDEDDVFWETLDNFALTQKAIDQWGSERKAIKAGQHACDMLEDGYRYNEVNMQMVQDYQNQVDMTLIGYTIFAGVSAYCPSYLY